MGGIPGWSWVKTLASKFKIKEKNDNYHKVELLDMPIVINSKTSIKIMDTSINVNYYVDCASYGVMALPSWYRPKMIKSNLYSKTLPE